MYFAKTVSEIRWARRFGEVHWDFSFKRMRRWPVPVNFSHTKQINADDAIFAIFEQEEVDWIVSSPIFVVIRCKQNLHEIKSWNVIWVDGFLCGILVLTVNGTITTQHPCAIFISVWHMSIARIVDLDVSPPFSSLFIIILLIRAWDMTGGSTCKEGHH